MFIDRPNPILGHIHELRGCVPFDIVNGPWVAGGAVRRMLTNEPLGDADIDIFFPSERSYNTALKKIRPHIDFFRGSRNAETMLFSKVKVQFVYKTWHPSPEDIFKWFDFSVCMFATDGSYLSYPSSALDDLHRRVLRLNPDYRSKHPVARLFKYTSYGFDPEPGMILKTLSQFKNVVSGIANDDWY